MGFSLYDVKNYRDAGNNGHRGIIAMNHVNYFKVMTPLLPRANSGEHNGDEIS